MHSTLLFSGALAGVASALFPYPAPAGAALVPRVPVMTASPALMDKSPRDLDSCNSVALSISRTLLGDAPTLGPSLQSYALMSPDALLPSSDACVNPVITEQDPQLQSEWTSFGSAYSSWQHAHLCDFRNVLDECSTIGAMSAIVFAPDVVCSTFLDELQSASCAGGKGTGSSGSAGSKSRSQLRLTFRPTATEDETSSNGLGIGTGTGTTSSPGNTGTPDAAAHQTVALGAVLVGVLAFVLGL